MFDIVPVILVMNDEFWLPYALSAVQGKFERYVIYNVGSADNTANIIDWFIETNKDIAQFYVRHLPQTDTNTQGIFRNSMIAEAQSEWYMILDGDEVYNPVSWYTIKDICAHERKRDGNKIYGIVERTEINSDLITCYSEVRPHHRIYHRTAIWKGTHPGEEPVIQQKPHREFDLPVMCYHFHNTRRSRLEEEVPSRIRRKGKSTYRPGELMSFNLLNTIPILREPIHTFPPHPELEKLQHDYKV